MKKKVLALMSLLLLMASCNDGTDSSKNSTPSSPSDNSSYVTPDSSTGEESTILVGALLTKIKNCLANESDASKETVKTTVTNSYTKTEKTLDLSIYSDTSSYGEGTVKEYDSSTDELKRQDSFKTRKKAQTDKVDDDGTISDLNMFYQVSSFEDDVFYTSEYSDSYSRVYVAKNDADAANLGLSEGQYILEEDLGSYVTLQSVSSLYGFIEQNISSNQYLSGDDLVFTRSTKGNVSTFSISNEYTYSSTDYEISGDTTIKIDANVVIDDAEKRVLSYKTSYAQHEKDASGEDESMYINDQVEEVTITYGDKSSPSSNAIDVNDYFISSVSEIDLFDSTSTSAVALDKSELPAATTRLYAKPRTFVPSTALDGDMSFLVPKSSSDETVAKIAGDGSYFSIGGKGKSVTLTYTYSSKNSSGVWEDTDISVDVHISEYDEPKSISCNTLIWSDDKVESYYNELIVGKTYSLTNVVSVYPKSAKQDITIVSSDSSVVRVDESNGEYSLSPLKEGKATITYTSVADPTISKQVEYKAYVPMTTDEATSYFKNKVFKYTETLYGNYTDILTFGSGDSGTFSADNYSKTTKFSWMASSAGRLTFYDYQPYDEDSEEDSNYHYGKNVIITADKNLWIERPSYYNSHLFVLEAN